MKVTRSVFPILFGLFYLGTALPAWPAGELDPAFSTDGKTRVAFGSGSGVARDVAVDANGRTLVVGWASSGDDTSFAVVRYLPDGSLDSSFGDSGVAITNVGIRSPNSAFSGQEEGRAIAIQPDGKIVVVGYVQFTTQPDFAVVRYNNDGSLDSSFGTGGISILDLGPGDSANDVAIQADNKIVVAGASNGNFAAARFNADGSLDQSFGNGGHVVLTGIIGDPVEATALKLQSDGKILLCGSPTAGSSVAFYIVRLTQTGSYDTTFGSGGLVGRGSAAGGGGHCTSIAIQAGNGSIASPDRIVAAGYTYNGSREIFVIMRFNLDGSPDTSFDGDGEVDTDLAGVPNGSARAAAVAVEIGQLNVRKIIVAGTVSRPSGTGTTSEAVVVRYNSSGTLDPAFDGDGVAVFDPAGAPNGMVLAAGKIVFTGGGFGRFVTTRVNSDGSPDTTFDQDGRRVDEIGGARSAARGIAVQPDGKVIVAGSGGGPFGINLSLARLNSDGTLDLSFDADGKTTGTFGTDAGATAVTLQPDGRILVAGARTIAPGNTDAAVYRFEANGALDTSFAGGVATSQYVQANDYANAIARLGDGRIVMGGFVVAGTNRDIEVVQFTEHGTLDATFDFDGKVVTSLSSGDDEVRAIAVQPDGKIVVAGYAVNDGRRQFLVARLNANGSFDQTFDQDGVAFTPVGSGDAGANGVVIDKAGRVLTAGFSSNSVNYDFTLVRYRPDGSLDPSFGNGGVVVTPISNGDDVGNAIVLQPDGKIVVAGGVSPNVNLGFGTADFAIVRYLENGTLDSSYGTGGMTVFGFSPLTSEGAYAVALNGSANAIVAGETDQLFGVARVLAGPLLNPATLANISTRLPVQAGDNALIGGFIVTGTQPKKVIVRALGPSVPVPGTLSNPTLELYSGATLIGSNDDWQNQPDADRQAVIDSTIPPSNQLESALVRTLPANGTGYTAIVRGANGGTGIGVVEAYDLDLGVDSKLSNISTRGFVQTGDNVLIAGTIILGETTQRIIARAIGPSLSIPGHLENPTLELRDSNGSVIDANDDWVNSPDKQAIIDSTIPPSNDLESAIVATLPSSGASYTAIVRGVNDSTGIGVVEVYALP